MVPPARGKLEQDNDARGELTVFSFLLGNPPLIPRTPNWRKQLPWFRFEPPGDAFPIFIRIYRNSHKPCEVNNHLYFLLGKWNPLLIGVSLALVVFIRIFTAMPAMSAESGCHFFPEDK